MSTNETKVAEASATTCVVGCKLPHGLTLELRAKDGEVVRYTAKGMNSARIFGGYGLTEGIPTDFMEAWLTKNAKHPAVVNQSIFMHSSGRGAQARAKELREVRTGLDTIDPLNRETQTRFKIAMDKDGERAYRKQIAENPMRNRQILE